MEGVMGQVLIRNVDDRVIESFKEKARLKGISLEQELRDLLARAASPSGEQRQAMLSEFHKKHGEITVSVNPEDFIRQDRETR
jgi:plasmid stability protein